MKMDDVILDWLLEESNPSVRYFALRYLLDRSKQNREVQAARRSIMQSELIQKILAAQSPEGYWAKPGHGYSPKYKSTVWQILFLAELGADGTHRAIKRGCDYLLDHAIASNGGFSAMADVSPSGAIYCLNGNLIWALGELGFAQDQRLRGALNWLTSAILNQDFVPGISGPNFECRINNHLPCAWGAVKSLRALANLPLALKSAKVKRAIKQSADFLLSYDLAQANYPASRRISAEWFKFGFPLSYTSDVLETLLALTEAGYARDPRLKNAYALVESKRGADGRWLLGHNLNSRTWKAIETQGKPSKWITLRALRVLKEKTNL